MKLKLIPQTRLTHAVRETPANAGRPLRPTDAPLAQKRQALYDAIGRTQAFMHKRQSPEDAMALIRRGYPAPLYFIESNRQALTRLELPRLDAFYYSMIPSLTRTALSQRWGMKPQLDALSKMAQWLGTLYIGVHVECFYLILLDRQGRLIRPVLLQRGAVDATPFYLGQVLSAALAEDARFIVLAHNHPGGTKRPSKEDLLCTLRALNAFAPLRIPLLDHLIVAGRDVVSIRQSGLLVPMVWTAAAPGSRIVREWLDGAATDCGE